jgi:hypothetical protein
LLDERVEILVFFWVQIVDVTCDSTTGRKITMSFERYR